MDVETKIHNCAECEYIRMYDYGKRIYYCDHEDRADDMGKLSMGKLSMNKLSKKKPKWCPLRKN